MLKPIISIIKLLIYSNLFVSICVTVFTHLTYHIYKLPTDNLFVILTMVFCFTFFTYNMQRIIKFRTYSIPASELGERLLWVTKHIKFLRIFSILSAIVGLICTFFIKIECWYLLIPMGACSLFYVIPLIPFRKNSPTLRQIPFLKIFVIGFVWSVVVVGIPFIDSSNDYDLSNPFYLIDMGLYSIPVFFFIIGITIPFDIRDLSYDNNDGLKTIPSFLGVRPSVIAAEICIAISGLMMYYFISDQRIFIGVLVGHIITLILVWFSNENRKEIFYSGLIEGTVIVLYLCVLISERCFFL